MTTILFLILGLLVANLSLLVILVVLYRKHFHWLSWLAHDFKDLNAYLYTTLSKQSENRGDGSDKGSERSNKSESEINSSAV